MTLLLTRLLFICLIPAGIFLLVQGIKRIRKALGGAVLLDIPIAQSEAQFIIPKEGNYAIWQKARTLSKVAVAMPMPNIHNEQTGKPVRLQYPFASVHTNNGTTGRVRVFTFVATAGTYRYHLSADASIRDSWVGKLRTRTKADTSGYSIEIKESRPAWWIAAGIVMLILSVACLIAGLIGIFHPGDFITN